MDDEFQYLSSVTTSTPAKMKAAEPRPRHDVESAVRLTLMIGVCLFSFFIISAVISELRSIISMRFGDMIAGYVYSSVFATMMTAVIWSTLGAGAYRYRLAFAFLWNIGILLATFSVIGMSDGGSQLPQFFVILSLILSAAWLLPQAPLWAIRILGGMRFDIPGRSLDEKTKQYGILHLLIATSLIAIFLGAGRAAISLTELELRPNLEAVLIFSYVIGGIALVSIPLWVAALLERHALGGVLIVLVLVAVAAYWQQTLLGFLINGPVGPSPSFFAWLSGFMAMWTLIFAYTMRRSGYRLVRVQR